ncbi:MAG: SH3 domain-containing protein [Burkholderiales bacterium]|nr:SH3 domain-containing protein [Burkholderiales bacterium]
MPRTTHLALSLIFCASLTPLLTPLAHAQIVDVAPKQDSSVAKASQRAERYPQFPQINFPQDSRVWALVSDLNVRVEPNPKAKVIAKLPIGTEVTVLSDPDKEPEMIQNSISAKWLRGRFTLNGSVREGYIWSGVLTRIRIKSVADDGTYFYLGMQGIKTDASRENDKMLNQIRAANNGVEIAKLSFIAPNEPHFNVAGASEGTQGLQGVNDVLMLNYIAQAHGFPYGEVIVFWTGTQFILGETAHKYIDTPVYDQSYWILPSEAGGKKGVIQWRHEAGESNLENNQPDKIISKETAEWIWTGSSMQKKM